MVEATDGNAGDATDCERRDGGDGVGWYLRCGGASAEWVSGVAVSDVGSIYVGVDLPFVGGSDPIRFGDFVVTPGDLSDFLVLKLDTAGDIVWVKHITLGEETYANVFPDQDPDVNGTNYDAFVAHLGDDGTPTSSIHIGTMLNDRVDRLHVDADEALVMSGVTEESFTLRAHVNGQTTWNWSSVQLASAQRHTALSDDGVIVAASLEEDVDLGSGTLAPRGKEDLVIFKVLH